MNKVAENVITLDKSKKRPARQTVLDNAANELVFAVVGHVGSGTTTVAQKLQGLLTDKTAIGEIYEVSYVKATDLITGWAQRHGKKVPILQGNKKTKEYVTQFQNLGDDMRLEDHAAVAREFCIQIRLERAKSQKTKVEPGIPIVPDGKYRAYILDSIRHPSEVQLLRHIYQDAFVLVGVVCETETRENRLKAKYKEAGGDEIEKLMARDEKAAEKNGQRVSDAFHLSDFFIDNTPNRTIDGGKANPAWDVAEKLSRLIKIIRQEDIIRPESGETAMWHAHGAAMRSVCLSRQVGAALIDRHGNLVATGTNEVPRAGGGVYGEGFGVEATEPDHRCAYRENDRTKPYCSNTKEQTEIVNGLLSAISKIKILSLDEAKEVEALLRRGRIGDLLEFSRAVHAEMDAIITAGRKAVSTAGTRMFVTTFPCHYCARHIVSAGIDEVQYIEPYPKSKALQLHSDSIQITAEDWVLPSSGRVTSLLPVDTGRKLTPHPPKVLFRPFTGVAPRLYRRSFLKEGDLKNEAGDKQVSPPEWGTPWHLRKMSYADIEAELAKQE